MDYREEALEKLKHNNVSIANMEVWIEGYITGRLIGRMEADKMLCQMYEARDIIPVGEYTSDFGYIEFKDL
jgi:hypothetical protein